MAETLLPETVEEEEEEALGVGDLFIYFTKLIPAPDLCSIPGELGVMVDLGLARARLAAMAAMARSAHF